MWTILFDPKAISFWAQLDQRSPLDEIVKEGTKRILQSAIDFDFEVEAFIILGADRTHDRARRYIVKNWSALEQEVRTGAGGIHVTRGRVRDKDPVQGSQVNSPRAYCQATCVRRLRLKGSSRGSTSKGASKLVTLAKLYSRSSASKPLD